MARETPSIDALIRQRKLQAAERMIAKKTSLVIGYLGEQTTVAYQKEEHDRDTSQVFPAYWTIDCRYAAEGLRIEGQITKYQDGRIDARSRPLEVTYRKKLVFKGVHVEKGEDGWEEEDLSDIEDSIEIYLPGDATWEPELNSLYARALRKEQRLRREKQKSAREKERRRIGDLRKRWKV